MLAFALAMIVRKSLSDVVLVTFARALELLTKDTPSIVIPTIKALRQRSDLCKIGGECVPFFSRHTVQQRQSLSSDTGTETRPNEIAVVFCKLPYSVLQLS